MIKLGFRIKKIKKKNNSVLQETRVMLSHCISTSVFTMSHPTRQQFDNQIKSLNFSLNLSIT